MLRYPLLQVQVNVPTALLHEAFGPHGLFAGSAHSSKSAQKNSNCSKSNRSMKRRKMAVS